MSNWRNPAITPEKYVKKYNALMEQYTVVRNSFNRRFATLAKLYADKYAPKQPGDTIDLPEGTKEGYNLFTVKEALPKIKYEKQDDNDKKLKAVISFDYYGEFSGPDVKPFSGKLNIAPDEKAS